MTIDGVLDAGYQDINYKGANNNVRGIAQNGSSTSGLNFRGSEDLGGGLRANFRFETNWNVVSGNANTGTASGINAGGTSPASTATQSINSTAGTFGNGEIRVGLASATLGAVDMGVVNYNSLTTFTTGQPFGTAIGSGFRTMFINDAQATSSVRGENAIRYTSPAFAGFRGTFYKSFKQTKAAAQGVNSATNANPTNLLPQANAFSTSLGAYDQQGTQEIGVNYAQGPIAASFSQLKQDFAGVAAVQSSGAAAGTAETTVNTFGANYAVTPAFKVFGLYQTQKTNTNTVDRTAMTLSTTYTMGNLVLMAQAGNLKEDAGANKGLKSKLWGIGADYNLSKRTAVYFRAESIDDKAKAMNAAVNPVQIVGTNPATSAADQKFARTAIGVRHSF